MWKGVWVILLAAGCVLAQLNRDLLLPEAVHIVGTVVDAEGKPIADASIDYTEAGRNGWRTNSEGRFQLDTRAPALVIRKDGFRSELLRTRDSTEPRITLQRITKTRTFPTCSRTGQYDEVDGLFQFRRIPEVKAG